MDWIKTRVLFEDYLDDRAAAVDELFQVLDRYTRAALRNRGLNAPDTDELSQTILMKIHVSRYRYDRNQPLRAWVVTIINRSLIDFWRKHGKVKFETIYKETDDGIPDAMVVRSHGDAIDAHRDVEKKLDLLKPIDRQIVYMHANEGKAMREIAAAVGLSPGAVKVRFHRALKAMRTAVTTLTAMIVAAKELL